MTSGPEWDELAAGLPVHQDEVMSAHEGAPSASQQAASHGAGMPPADLGADEAAKYGPPPPAR